MANQQSKNTLAVIAATLWISISEFTRNEILFKDYWISHYGKLGLDFPDAPVNGAVWGLWSLLFAFGIFRLSNKFSLTETTLLSWFFAFAMMWVAIGNLNVLPYNLLIFAVPLSLLESGVASWIVFRLKA